MNRMMRRMMLMGVGRNATIPLVPTLPADASLYAGQVYLAPRWPLLASAPGTVVNGQRFRLPGGTYGVEYLGVGGSWVAQPSVTFGTWKSRPTINLQGLDVFSLPLIQNMATTDWKIFGSVYDLSATSSVSPFFRAKKGAGNPLTISINSANQLSCSFRDNTESIVLTFAVPVTINNQQFQYTVEKSGTTATLTLIYAGLNLSVSGNIGATFDGDGIDQFRYSDEVPGIRPVLVYGHQSWINGSLVDTFPCDDGTGLTVRNTTTPSRPGTITDNSPNGVWVYSWDPTT